METSTLVSSVISSIIIPIFLTLLVNKKWSERVKYVSSILITIGLTTVLVYTQNNFSLDKLYDSVLLTLFLTETNYRVWFKKSIFQGYLEKVLGMTKDQSEAALNLEKYDATSDLVEPKPYFHSMRFSDLGESKTIVPETKPENEA